MKIKHLVLIFTLTFSSMASAIEGVYEVIIKKQQEKQSSRWSLASYLAQKNRISLMDQWLALNTESNIFEMILDYGAFEYDQDALQTSDNQFKASFYASILGLEFFSQNQGSSLDNYAYNLSLRFFGSSSQSTHLNFLYGQSHSRYDSYGRFSQSYYGFEGDIYLLGFLGLSGRYEKSSKASSQGTSMFFETRNFGGFIELSFIRFYYYKKAQSFKFGNSLLRRDGDVLGLSLFL